MALSLRHLIRAVVCFLFPAFASALNAQTPAPEAPPPRFRVVSMSGVESFFFDVEKKKESINAGAGSFSRLYPAPKTRSVVFYHEVPNPENPTLPPVKKPIARASLPGSTPGPFLIVLAPNPAGAETAYGAMVVDSSLEAHPAKTYRVFNFSKRRLAANVADTKMLLDRGASQTAPYPNTRKAWLQVAADTDPEGWLLVSSSSYPVGADSRTTIFLVDIAPSPLDPNPKGIVARRIRETIVTDDKGVQHLQ